jgi:hypothetical protein
MQHLGKQYQTLWYCFHYSQFLSATIFFSFFLVTDFFLERLSKQNQELEPQVELGRTAN